MYNMCSADVCVFVFRIQCVWCVCDVLYLISLNKAYRGIASESLVL